MTTKKTTNRPVFAASKSASESDNKALGARFAAFATLKEAGVTVDSIKGNGADYADFKEGILIGWQGAAFAKKFLSTSDGKAILTGRKIVGQNAFEPVTKAKEDWARDVSAALASFAVTMLNGSRLLLRWIRRRLLLRWIRRRLLLRRIRHLTR